MSSPLADRIRPTELSDMVGQSHIFGENSLFSNLINSNHIPNIIFYGPPGTGKTTTAKIICKKANKTFFKINATNSSLSEIKNIISEINPITAPNGAILYIDEIQYFNKKQQQSLLEYIENGKITLIASTTENPYFYVYNALLSRSNIFEFKALDKNDIKKAIKRAINFLENERNIKINYSEEFLNKISQLSGGDVRKAINNLELLYFSSGSQEGSIQLDDTNLLNQIENNYSTSYNKTGDEHFNLLSALQKSLRGSDPHASIYYLAKLLKSGELISACRRILVCACEDVGLAYPNIFSQIKSLTDIALQVGMPEARIPLADAVILIALSPKSNSAYKAINEAFKDLEYGYDFPVPRHLQNVHCDSTDSSSENPQYKYPHSYPDHWVKQQYLPDNIKNKKYYYPQENKNETAFKNYREKITKETF